MFDPFTQAFEICYPWKKKSEFIDNYHEPFITVWHVDPCSDGTDDSCGWSYPNIDKNLIDHIKSDLEFECKNNPNGLKEQKDRETYLIWQLLWVQRASYWSREKGLTPKQIAKFLFDHSFPGERDFYTHLPEDLEHEAYVICRIYKRLVRKWYQHPKWHFWHWKFQIHPVQKLKRFLFSRCCICKRGFKWDQPVIGSWEGTGPLWFRSEKDVRHSSCYDSSTKFIQEV